MNAQIDVMTEDLRLFLRCVSDGSLSAAARALGITQAVATRRIQRLESALGGPVLHRTTRALRPTVDGERLLGTARTMIAELTELERARGESRGAAKGEVRVSAPVLLGQSIGATLASTLAKSHPELRLVLSLSNARVDLVRDHVDIALRVGALPNATLLSARIVIARIGAYARRDHATNAKHPSELVDGRWIGHAGDAAMRASGPNGARWTGRVQYVFTCDDRMVLRDAVLAGLGIALLPTFMGDADPALRRMASEWSFGRVPIHALWLPESRHDPRVRTVLEAATAWGRASNW